MSRKRAIALGVVFIGLGVLPIGTHIVSALWMQQHVEFPHWMQAGGMVLAIAGGVMIEGSIVVDSLRSVIGVAKGLLPWKNSGGGPSP